MDKPFQLKPTARIGICAPSARFNIEKFNICLSVLKNMGFDTHIPDEIFLTKRYLAGEDRHRAKVVEQLFADSDIDAIICARGGFGAMRMLQYLDWDLIKSHPKPVIGFSDSTALLLAIESYAKFPVIHGPTLLSLGGADTDSLNALKQILMGCLPDFSNNALTVLAPGNGTGKLLGGNLSTICHLIGTPFQPQFDDCIVFIEDVGEPAYKIDRMLFQLKLAGCFENIKGVVTGSFKNCDFPEYIDQVLIEIFGGNDIPVMSNLPAGHGQRNHCMYLGLKVKMDTLKKSVCWVE